MGEDNLVQFENWKNSKMILDYYSLYVYPRPNTPAHNFENHLKVKFVEAPLLDISATYIRKLLSEGKEIKYLVTEPVEDYIRIKKFYS
jgi:nicotinate-nucleotide adenylyltransferase